MKRPNRDDYHARDWPCALEDGFPICGGCEEYDAALREWIDSYDPYAAADARADEIKDEDIHRG